MDEDVDMDSPHISTLREENTPPPSRQSKFRVKLVVNEGKRKTKGKSSSPTVAPPVRKPIPPPPPPQPPVPVQSEDELDVDEEDEEDQLIDDDDDMQPSTSAATASASAAANKRKAPAKKPRPRKSAKQDKVDVKKVQEPQEAPENWDAQSANSTAAAATDKPPPKKKAAPRKPPAAQRTKAKPPPKTAKTLAIPPLDDGVMSDAYTGTAPSSPFPHEGGSPEPEEIEPPTGDANFDNTPMPVYPLPSKPFPVQPPPKIGTGFAPVLPLDRSGTKVRRWRTAHREIRGIAGGRWFARSWVGDKESELAATIAAKAAAEGDKVGLAPTAKSVAPSISAPPLGKGAKAKASRAMSGASVGPSRAGSIVPDLHPVKAPTKMRNIVAGPASEAGNDSDVVAQDPSTTLPESQTRATHA